MKKLTIALILLLFVSVTFGVIGSLSGFVGETNPFNISMVSNTFTEVFISIPLYGYTNNISITITPIIVSLSNSTITYNYLDNFNQTWLHIWRFNYTNNDIINGNHIDDTRNLTVLGQFDVAKERNSATQLINATNLGDPGRQPLTISTWLDNSFGDTTGNVVFFSGQSGDEFAFIDVSSSSTTCTHRSNAGTNTVSVNTATQDNDWYHIICTVPHTGNVTLYINGNQTIGQGVSQGVDLNGRVNLGEDNLGSDDLTNFFMDDLIILFNYSMNVDEAIGLYNSYIIRLENISISLGEKDKNFQFGPLNTTNSTNVSLNFNLINTIINSTNSTCGCTDCVTSGDYCQVPIYIKTSNNPTVNVLLYNSSYLFCLDNNTNSCNIPSSAEAINYSFVDEQNSSRLRADVDSTFNYSIGTELSATFDLDSNEVSNFSLFVYPSWAQITTGTNILYSQDPEYPQRTFTESETLDSSTIYRTLEMLHADEGIYGRFKTVDTLDNVISGVTAEMLDKTTQDIIASHLTDSAGLATFWLDPNTEYTFRFSKTGFPIQTFNLRVTSGDIYTIIMGDISDPVNLTDEIGSSYQFFPLQSTLQNNTDYTFTFNLTSVQNAIQNCTFYIRDNESTTLSQSTSSFDDTACNIAITQNTNSFPFLTASATYVLNGSSITKQRVYTISTYVIDDYTLMTVFDDLSNFEGAGFNGGARAIVAVIIIIALTFYLSNNFTPLSNTEPILLFVLGMVAIFSWAGWFFMDFAPIPDIPGFDLKKWIVFILMALYTGSHIAWRHR